MWLDALPDATTVSAVDLAFVERDIPYKAAGGFAISFLLLDGLPTKAKELHLPELDW